MKKFYFQGLTALIVLLCSFQARAQAPILNHIYKLVCRSTGQVLEIGGDDNLNDPGRGANTWGYWGGVHQQWFFVPYPANGSAIQGYTIVNRNSRLLLSGYNPNAGSGFTQEGATYNASNPNSVPSSSQLWTLQQVSGTAFVIKLGNYCLTADGNNNVFKQAYDPNNGTMIWDIVDVSANASLDYTQGSFQLINRFSTYALSSIPAYNDSRAIAPFPSVGAAYQEWTFVPSPTRSGYYYIVSRRSNGLILEIGGGETNNGASVNLWENYQHPWQEWAFLDINDSHILQPSEFTDGRFFKIYSLHAGKVLEYRYVERTDSRIVDIYNDFGQTTQQWRMRFDSYNRTASPLAINNATESATSAVQVYPNPATETLAIRVGSAFNLATIAVGIMDAQGRKVHAPYHDGKIDIATLSAGLYIVTISNGEQTVHQKFTKL